MLFNSSAQVSGERRTLTADMLLGLSAAILLATFLLSFQLGTRSFWWDEYNAVNNVNGDLPSVIRFAAGDVHPPLYFLSLWAWERIFSTSEWSTRALSMFLALLSVPVVYVLGAALSGKKAGVLVALLMIASPFFLLYARMVRYFSLYLLVGALASWLFIRAVRRPTKRRWLAYALGSITLMYVHYLGAGVLILHGAFLWLARRTRIRAWLFVQAGVVIAYLPWAAVVLQQFRTVQEGVPADFAGSYLNYVLKAAYGMYVFAVGETLFPWNPFALGGLLAVGGLTLFGAIRLFKLKRPIFLFLGIGLVVSLLWTSIATSMAAPTMPFIRTPAYMFYAFPLFCVLVAAGVLYAPAWSRLLLALLLMADLAGIVNYYTGRQFHNPIYAVSIRQAVELVMAQEKSGDVIIADSDTVFNVYYEQLGGRAPYTSTAELDTMKNFVSQHNARRVWLVTFGRDRTRQGHPAEPVADWLAQTHTLADNWGYVEEDAGYRALKEKWLGRTDYDYKVLVRLYVGY